MGEAIQKAETAFAIIGAILWAVLPIPQIIKSFRLKSTKGLSPLLMLLWALSALFVCSYAIVRNLSLALIIEPHLFGIFAAVSWCQCLLYEQGLSLKHTVGAFFCFIGLYAFIETTSIFTMMFAEEHFVTIPTMLYGYTASVLTVVGLIPQFIEIFRLKQVVGISMIFLWIGILGGFSMFASLCCRPKLDFAAAAVYLATSFLNLAIWILALILNPRAKRLGIFIGDDPAVHTPAATVPVVATSDVEMAQSGKGAISLEDTATVPTIAYNTNYNNVGVGLGRPDTAAFELQMPQAPFVGGSSNVKGGEYGYDYSPPVTPLETPAPGYEPNVRTSYFSSVTLAEDGKAAEFAEDKEGKDDKKGGGEV